MQSNPSKVHLFQYTPSHPNTAHHVSPWHIFSNIKLLIRKLDIPSYRCMPFQGQPFPSHRWASLVPPGISSRINPLIPLLGVPSPGMCISFNTILLIPILGISPHHCVYLPALPLLSHQRACYTMCSSHRLPSEALLISPNTRGISSHCQDSHRTGFHLMLLQYILSHR